VDLIGTDWRAGLLWTEYIMLLKHTYNVQQKKENPDAEVSGRVLAEDASPIEAARRAVKPGLRKVEDSKPADLSDEEFLRVGEVLKIDASMLRAAFQRCASTAHSALDKLWIGYEQFEKSLGNPQLAQKLLGDHMPRYVRGKAAFKELNTIANGIDHFAVAVPLRERNAVQQGKLLEKWRRVFQFERTNPLRLERKALQGRVAVVYQQAALSLAFQAEVWHDFASWLDLGNQRDEATTMLRRAVERFLPQDLTLRLLIAHRHEIAEVAPSPASLQLAEDEYRKLLDDMPKPCPLALINHLAFVRRQHGAVDFRDSFLEATDSSAHCTWEVYWFAALTEYHVFGSSEAAARVFRLGLERYGEREPSLLAAYVNFLIGTNDMQSARAELSRSVVDRLQAGVRDFVSNRDDPMVTDCLSFFWQKWARLESYFGDAAAVRRATSFRDEEYRNLQRDQEIEDEAVVETPAALGLSTTIDEVAEGFRFQHLVPKTARVKEVLPGAAETAPAIVDQALSDAAEEHRRFASALPTAGLSVHIARPDVSKMLAFRPALDVIARKRGSETTAQADENAPLPTMIPKCLQDLLAVLPSRSLKGAKPDVDYLLTVLQTVQIPPVQVKELEHFRYDSLRLLKEEDGALRRSLVKDELDGDGGAGFFSTKPTVFRERLAAKRQKVIDQKRDGAVGGP